MSKSTRNIPAIVIVLSCLFLSSQLAAEVADKSDIRNIIMLIPSDQKEASDPVITALKSQLSDQRVNLKIHTIGPLEQTMKSQILVAQGIAQKTDAIAVFWCDFGDDEQVFLHLTEYEGNRVLVRRIHEGDESDRGAEAIAIIVRSSIAEMLKGGQIGVTSAEAITASLAKEDPPPIVPPVPIDKQPEETVEDSHRNLSSSIAYHYYGHSSEIAAAHGLNLLVDFRFQRNFSVFAGYTFFQTLKHRGETSTLRLNRHPIQLGLRLRFVAGIFEIGGAVALNIDFATFENDNLNQGMTPETDTLNAVISMVPALEMQVFLNKRLHLFVSPGLDIPFNGKCYITKTDDGSEEVLLDTWKIHPTVLVGFVFEII